jgi:hypothetical protein
LLVADGHVMTVAKSSNLPEAEPPDDDAVEAGAQADAAALDLSIQIELEYPGEFLLFCVPATNARETHNALRKSLKNWLYGDCEIDDYIKAVVANTKLTTNLLPNNQLEEFYHFVENGVLSEEMQHRCFQAEMVVQLLAEGNEQLTFFAPFWTAMVAGSFFTGEIDAILVDAYNSRGFDANFPAWQHNVDGVPLSHQFLSVTGNAQDGSNKMRLHTTGMSRFGLPELVVHEVLPEYGQEMAYVLRGLAQYMWSAIEKLLPASSTLQLNEELDLPSSFCELDKAQACKIAGQLLPISLCWGESNQGRSNLIVSPTMDFEAEEDWFETIVNAVRREKLQLSALSSDRLII